MPPGEIWRYRSRRGKHSRAGLPASPRLRAFAVSFGLVACFVVFLAIHSVLHSVVVALPIAILVLFTRPFTLAQSDHHRLFFFFPLGLSFATLLMELQS